METNSQKMKDISNLLSCYIHIFQKSKLYLLSKLSNSSHIMDPRSASMWLHLCELILIMSELLMI